MVVLNEHACVQQSDAHDLLQGVDVQRVFFFCSINICSGRDSFVLAVELDELLELLLRSDEVLFLPEVVEQVRGVEGVEVCKDAGGVIGDFSNEAGDGPVVVRVSVGHTQELLSSVWVV